MPTYTTNYSIPKPLVNDPVDQDLWGTELNSGMDIIDAAIKTVSNSVAAASSVGKHTIWVPATAMIARTTNGAVAGTVETTTNKIMIKTLDFDPVTQQFAQFSVAMPKGWDLGTFTFQPVWSHAATTVNFNVTWGLQALALGDNTAFDTAFGTAQTSADTGGTTNNQYIGVESSAITAGGTPIALNTVLFQINRNVGIGGNLAIAARLEGVRLYYTLSAATDT